MFYLCYILNVVVMDYVGVLIVVFVVLSFVNCFVNIFVVYEREEWYYLFDVDKWV